MAVGELYILTHHARADAAQRRYPAAPFTHLTTIATVESRIERADKLETERRCQMCSPFSDSVFMPQAVSMMENHNARSTQRRPDHF